MFFAPKTLSLPGRLGLTVLLNSQKRQSDIKVQSAFENLLLSFVCTFVFARRLGDDLRLVP